MFLGISNGLLFPFLCLYTRQGLVSFPVECWSNSWWPSSEELNLPPWLVLLKFLFLTHIYCEPLTIQPSLSRLLRWVPSEVLAPQFLFPSVVIHIYLSISVIWRDNGLTCDITSYGSQKTCVFHLVRILLGFGVEFFYTPSIKYWKLLCF